MMLIKLHNQFAVKIIETYKYETKTNTFPGMTRRILVIRNGKMVEFIQITTFIIILN